MAAKFELKTSPSGQFMFNLKAKNGEIILTSELYRAKSAALAGIESVKKNASLDERYERKTGKNGQPFFVLKAGNREVIGRSEMYSSTSSMENGIASVKRNAADAVLNDITEVLSTVAE